MNLVRGRVEKGSGGGLEAVLGSQRLVLTDALLSARPALAGYEGREVVVGIRPEALQPSLNGSAHRLVMPVLLTEALGSDQLVHLDLDAPAVITGDMLAISRELPGEALTGQTDATHARITARIPPGAAAQTGHSLALSLDPARMHFFDPETELAI